LQVQVIAKHLAKSFPIVELGESLSRSFSRLMKKHLSMDPQACSVVINKERNCFYFAQQKCQPFVVLCTIYSWEAPIPVELQEQIKDNVHGILGLLATDEYEPLLEVMFMHL